MKYLLILLIVAVILFLIENYRELHKYVVTNYDITIPDSDGSGTYGKVVFLSDLHNHVYGKDNAELISTIKNLDPDYIWVGGDMLVGKSGEPVETALSFLKSISKIAPVYYALGNHEQRLKIYPEDYDISFSDYQNELKKEGIVFLENDSVDLSLKGLELKLTGLEIPARCYTHFRKEVLEVSEIEDLIGPASKERFHVLMAHNPTYGKVYLNWGANLILSGHLHGGIIRIPGIGGLIAPNFEIFPKYSGDYYKEGSSTVVVSRGLGTHTFNIRIFNAAELVVLHLKAS